MRISLLLLAAVLGFALAGCYAPLSGDFYDPPMAKHPLRLHLSNDGTYSFGQMHSSDARLQRGRWWRVQEGVVMLVPDDSTKPQWFARADRKNLVKQLRYSNSVRDVLAEPAP